MGIDRMILTLLTALFASAIGKICGMGGGVLIKPIMDALGIFSVNTINFYSACTVTAMSGWSVVKSLRSGEKQLDLRVSTPLAVGAAFGGFVGKALYAHASALFPDPNAMGGVQAVLLFVLTLLTFIYTVKKAEIKSWQVRNPVLCSLIGFTLGALGAFLGIGGGPFNMAALYLFFSMPIKQAAQNSLYIILISQIAGLLKTFLSPAPTFEPVLLLGMMLCGMIGSEFGSHISKRLDGKKVMNFFEASMLLVMGISIHNFCMYLR